MITTISLVNIHPRFLCTLKLEKQGLHKWLSAWAFNKDHMWIFANYQILGPLPQILFIGLGGNINVALIKCSR